MTKEISKEVRARVYGLYLGADIDVGEGHTATLVGAGLDNFNTIEHSVGSYGTHPYNGRDKLILSDLSDISDEDAVEVAKIVIGDSEDFTINKAEGVTFVYGGDYRLGIWADNDFIILDYRHGTTHAPNVIEAIDFLRSRGYMLPAFGITDLFEAGIAVRKNKEV